MELALALPLGLLFTGAIEKEKRFIYLFAAGLMAVALIMTNSRGGIISLVAEMLFLVATMGLRRRRHKKKRESEERQPRIKSAAMKAGLALALIVALFGGVVLLGGEDALSRFVGSVNTDDPTTGRAHFWSVTVDIIKNHPLIGTGLGRLAWSIPATIRATALYRLEQAHNDYLQVLSDGGIVGAALGCFSWSACFAWDLRGESRATISGAGGHRRPGRMFCRAGSQLLRFHAAHSCQCAAVSGAGGAGNDERTS